MINKNIRWLFAPFIASFIIFSSVYASAATEIETNAKYAYMIDYDTGQVLFEKNADEEMGPSSMTKLMTGYMIFDALKNGGITMETTFPVSIKAWKKGGSKMYVKEGDNVALEDLIPGILVVSGNDACIVVAEGMAGSEELFAEDMNAMAERIGLTGSHFKNASGWPEDGHVMTVKDLVTLSKRLYKDFPQYYHYFSQPSFTYADIKQANRNKLLYKNIGVDGLKTGYTSDNGYGIVVSAEQDGRRVFIALNGMESSRQRVAEAQRMVRYGFNGFRTLDLYSAGDAVESANVWMGKEETVPLVMEEDLKILTKKRISQQAEYNLSVSYEGPIAAPIEKGQQIAELILKKDGEVVKQVPLVAGKSVERLGLLGRMQFVVMHKLFGSD